MNTSSSRSLITSKMQQREHELHRQRLFGVRSKLDNARPRTPSHVRYNAKKALAKKDESMEIQRRNNILLQKLFDIDVHPSRLNPGALKGTQQKEKSLNRAVREREFRRITDQNQAMLRKIQEAATFYPAHKTLEKTKQSAYIKENLCGNSNRFERNTYFLNLHPEMFEKEVRYYTFETPANQSLHRASGNISKRVSRPASAKQRDVRDRAEDE